MKGLLILTFLLLKIKLRLKIHSNKNLFLSKLILKKIKFKTKLNF